TPLPAFTEPDDALGDDVFEHLDPGGQGRRWRSLLTEAQVILHNHPWHARRIAAGTRPGDSVWFWGGGELPDQVRSPHARVCIGDGLAAALAAAAGVGAPLPARFDAAADGGDVAYDLTALRDMRTLERDWLEPALDALGAGRIASLVLDTADGTAFTLARGHRWRIWRRPRRGFHARWGWAPAGANPSRPVRAGPTRSRRCCDGSMPRAGSAIPGSHVRAWRSCLRPRAWAGWRRRCACSPMPLPVTSASWWSGTSTPTAQPPARSRCAACACSVRATWSMPCPTARCTATACRRAWWRNWPHWTRACWSPWTTAWPATRGWPRAAPAAGGCWSPTTIFQATRFRRPTPSSTPTCAATCSRARRWPGSG